MKYWKLQGCPRCGGDVFTSEGLGGATAEECLQCGWEREALLEEALGLRSRDVPVEVGSNGHSEAA